MRGLPELVICKYSMILLLSFAFLSGLVTILAPCIWPLLPIILSASSLSKNHTRPLGITLGIMLSFGFFTLFISYLVKLFHIDPNVLRLIAVIVIGFLGITLVIPSFSSYLEVLVSRLSGFFGQKQIKGQDFTSGFFTGISLGIVWTPCAGPILAAIAALSATGKVTSVVILITFFYVLGTGIPLFIFAYAGQQLVQRTRFISSHLGQIQQVFGIVMILFALAIYTNYDTYLQSQLLNAFPVFNAALNGFENNSALTNQLHILKGQMPTPESDNTSGLFNQNSLAPDFAGITTWLNLPNGQKSLSLQSLRGKVVLVDFWTYTCINCIRTLPHVTSWYNTYNKYGFVVVGIHTPEFAFEHDTQNVKNAIKMFGIFYPVGQDNNYATWNNYNNQYWPAEYLIDAQGNIRRFDFGEGQYDQMELAIRELLKQAGHPVTSTLTHMPDATPNGQQSPETYVGSNRMQYYYPTGVLQNGTQTLTLPQSLPVNSFSLGGMWTINPEFASTGSDSELLYHFQANKVFLVMSPGRNVKSEVKVFLDGKLVDSTYAGQDVQNGVVTVDTDRLYNLIDLHDNPGAHILKLEFLTPGIQVFAFTFG